MSRREAEIRRYIENRFSRGTKLYYCELCGESFAVSDLLRKHLDNCAAGIEPIVALVESRKAKNARGNPPGMSQASSGSTAKSGRRGRRRRYPKTGRAANVPCVFQTGRAKIDKVLSSQRPLPGGQVDSNRRRH
ncbi:hypothetical protein SBA7_610052 [Candidatus Sulfotelmatobacter sp. SbA7]|nr:hypothetical protein SBA7_610052 [Candidatus Sulfotelmatobacter sp. SbA7]